VSNKRPCSRTIFLSTSTGCWGIRTRIYSTSIHLGADPASELRNFGEDSWFSVAFSGTKRNDTDDGSTASKRTTRITHASRPSSGLSKGNRVRGFVPAPNGLRLGAGPNLARYFLQLIGELFGMSSYESPPRQSAGLATVISSRGWQRGSANSSATSGASQLQKGDIILELLRTVE